MTDPINTQPRTKIFIQLSFIALTLTLVFFIIGFFSKQKTHSNTLTNIQRLEYQVDSLEQGSLKLQAILELDNLVFGYNFDSALNNIDALYSSLDSNNPYIIKDVLLRKIYIENILNTSDSSRHTLSVLNHKQKATSIELNELRLMKDSIISYERKIAGEAQSETERLSSELKVLKNELSKKDKIQVISFKNKNGNLIHYLGEVNNGKAHGGGGWNLGLRKYL